MPIDLKSLNEIYEGLKKLKEKWAPDDGRDIDDAEEMWMEIPNFLNWAVPTMGIALDLIQPPKIEIVSAIYESERKNIDVTEKIRSSINKNAIEIQILNTTFNHDPDYGQKKNLRVEYKINGESKTEIVLEGQWLRIGVA
jgi:hypothetical protein